jgi:small subunit ribosomal protein S4
MSRYLLASCKICRRNREKLFLKGARCFSAKCAIEKRNYPPGHKSVVARKMSEYGRRLREKQKLRFFYGVSEIQMRNYFSRARSQKGMTGHNLLCLFERRLDNVLYRAHLASSRKEARQLIRHGHFELNGKSVDVPSISVSEGQVITVRSGHIEFVKERFKQLKDKTLPTWIRFNESDLSLQILHIPNREEIDVPVQEQLIVEFYSM